MSLLPKFRPPFYYTIILCVAFATAAYIFGKNKSIQENMTSSQGEMVVNNAQQFELKRLSGYSLIRPLMFVEIKNKSQKYEALNQKIVECIEAKKKSNDITGASFYFHDLYNTEWTGYNEEEKYNPGSLMKVPELISILRYEEEKPGLLDKQLFYKAAFVTNKKTRFLSKELEPGRSYSVRELLNYMIAYSDNNATVLLDENLDQTIFNKTLTEMGLPLPEKGALNYPVSSKQFSLFMRAIYNAAYLTIPHSEFAAKLLTTSKFEEGFAKGFPPGIKMMHKFGEAGNEQEVQLHESCIVYVNSKAYVITVMTKGTDMMKLSKTLSDIAAIVYQEVAAS